MTPPQGSNSPTARSSPRTPLSSWARGGRPSPKRRGKGFLPWPRTRCLRCALEARASEELREKAAWYLANGVRLVVLLDPYLHRVEVFRPGGVEGHQGPERVPLDPGLPGFALETRGLFLP